ncbi:MAG: 50S ribosomal protein L29 [Bacteroidota bacterium]
MKNADIRALAIEELQERLATETENLQKLKFAHEISPLENPMQIREARKTVARIKTEIAAKTAANN